MAKVHKLLQRSDGSEVKIVAESMQGYGLHVSMDFYVLRRESQSSDWELLSKEPHPRWREMAVDEYVKEGRPQAFKYASLSEILSTIHHLSNSI